MGDPVIQVENLGKIYLLARQQERLPYTTLRDALARQVAAPLRALLRLARASGGGAAARPATQEAFWALRQVSFGIQPGEVVGIIGRNGAGKSTLLKILSRITEPTEGRVVIRGRVASLLEVGTGFHAELSGRENIFLNGAILGMTRAEIRRKFDDIVAFADVERFLDTPVKRYSSGMYVRLAFAVAAHLEPEILIVDEVLAVGDAEFQRKCLGKMRSVASGGRTVLFVSHNMAAVQALCPRAILLEAGQVRADGGQEKVIGQYLASGRQATGVSVADRRDRQGDGSARLISVAITAADGEETLTSTKGLRITLHYAAAQPLVRPKILIGLYDGNEGGIYGLDSEAAGGLPETLPAGGVITCVTAPVNLTAGPCSLNIALFSGGAMADYVQHAAELTIEPADFYGNGRVTSREWMVGLIGQKWSLGEAG